MHKRILASAFVTAALAGFALPASAASLFTVSPGAIFGVPANNDFQASLAGVGLQDYTSTGASVTLNASRRLKFEYLGSESGFLDHFNAGTLPTFFENNMNQGVGNFTPVFMGADDFLAGAFTNVSFGSSAGMGLSTIGMASFGIFIPRTVNEQLYNTDALYFGFDDQINNIDDNHDDFIVRVSAVPEPATWLSMVLGFGLLGTMIRRRRSLMQTQVVLA